MAQVPYQPAGYRSVAPYLVVRDVPGLVDFLVRVFGGVEVERSTLPDGTVLHAEVRIGDSIVMMGAARGESEPTRTALYVYVPDADAVHHAALAAGATSLRAPANQFYGDRCAGVRDPFGNDWWMATHLEDVAPDEMERRLSSK